MLLIVVTFLVATAGPVLASLWVPSLSVSWRRVQPAVIALGGIAVALVVPLTMGLAPGKSVLLFASALPFAAVWFALLWLGFSDDPSVREPAGWYAVDPSSLCWWDGDGWTEHYRPIAQPAPPAGA